MFFAFGLPESLELSTKGGRLPDSSLPDPTRKSQQVNPPPQGRWGIAAFAILAAMLFTGASSPSGCDTSSSSGSIGPSNGQVVGAAIGIGAVIAVAIIVSVEINRSHHVLTGCVVTSSNGLDLHTSDGKIYSLEGDAASIKVGDKVKLHGTKIKKAKDSTGLGVFKVEKLNRSYGPCPIAATTASLAH